MYLLVPPFPFHPSQGRKGGIYIAVATGSYNSSVLALPNSRLIPPPFAGFGGACPSMDGRIGGKSFSGTIGRPSGVFVGRGL